MNLTTYFTTVNAPALGLTPIISVWELDGSVVVNAQTMTEVAGGFYVYNFIGYDYTKDYVIQGYASALAPSEQYVIGTNDVDSQRNQGVIKQILGMVQSNFRMENQTYDDGYRLLTADIFTYENATDADADINRLHEYTVEATYDGTGRLNSYKVVDV